jgi:hypothetical protein
VAEAWACRRSCAEPCCGGRSWVRTSARGRSDGSQHVLFGHVIPRTEASTAHAVVAIDSGRRGSQPAQRIDHVAFALVKGGPNAPTRQTMFPVTKSVANFAKTAGTSLRPAERHLGGHRAPSALSRGLSRTGSDPRSRRDRQTPRDPHHGPSSSTRDNPRDSEHELQGISDITFQSELVIALDDPDLDLYGPVRETFDFVAPALPLLRQLLDWTAETLETLDVFATPRSGQDH